MNASQPRSTLPILWKHRGSGVDYTQCWQAMRAFVQSHEQDRPDEIWSLEHAPVYTLGLAGKPEHLTGSSQIPCVRSDRGGQITYHGPGQLVIYCMLTLKRYDLNVRSLVDGIEGLLVTHLSDIGIEAVGDRDRRGVYVNGRKIASIGLKISRGICYHGLALNVDGDLSPFDAINPCGYPGLHMTCIADELNSNWAIPKTVEALQSLFQRWLGSQINPITDEDLP